MASAAAARFYFRQRGMGRLDGDDVLCERLCR
jgi:hypothetical protein